MSAMHLRGSLRVLIVDDDADQRFVVRRLLERAGIDHIGEAADGDEGLRTATELRPDLILLDLAMPVRSGIDVLPALRLAVPEANVVVLSNLPPQRLRPLVRRLGAVGFVEKRVAPDRLVHEVLLAAAFVEGIVASASGRFAAATTSPRHARELVRDVLGAHDDELVSSAELLVSELVSNTVLHTSGAPLVEVRLTDDLVRVEVYDTDASMPRRRVPDADSPGGRGLLLLDRIASRWGADPVDDGKVVWFELDRSASS